MKEKIIFAILTSLLVFPLALASISCPSCIANNNCQCTISDCANGLVDFYPTQNCADDPSSEYTFANNGLSWYPDSAATYYVQAICDDFHTRSPCSSVIVSNAAPIITTTSSSYSSPSSTSSTTTSGNTNMVLYVLIIVIIAVIAFIVYRLFTKKKKGKIDYETLYKKWGK